MKRKAIGSVAVIGLVLASCGSDDTADSPDAEATPDDAADESATDESATDESATDESATEDASDAPAGDAETPTIVVTTNILGDVVSEVVGDSANVVTIMPVGADPHDFQASAQEVDALVSADALIVNGASFEEGLLDVIENATDEGVPTFEAISVVDTIEFGEGGHDHGDEHSDDEHSDEDKDDDHDHEEHSDEEHGDEDHSDEEHADEDHSDEEHADEEHSDEDKDDDHDHGDEEHSDEEHSDEEHGDEEHSDEEHSDEGHDDHDHSGADPHFFTDPMRMAEAVEGIVDFLQAEINFADPSALDSSADAYIAELVALDGEIDELVAAIPEEGRVLITNHEVFGYYADRYGFEVVGAVIPSGSTADNVSAGELAELAETLEDEGVPAIFSDTSASDELVQTLAVEVGEVDVVALFTESLGDADSEGSTYLDMVRTNSQRISSALS